MGFLSAGLSSIMGISTFGLFAALVLIFDFFLAITLFAATFYFCETNYYFKLAREEGRKALGIEKKEKTF
jgi:predicted RND superfamily exporter protein